jgi:hypothetical protein
MSNKKDTFMFYPEITDEDFNEKIYIKKEFRDTEVTKKYNYDKTNINSKTKDFMLDPHQLFLKNYISPETPYNGILVFHSTGVGKCLKKGTPIILYNGKIINVEDVKPGDILMGDDSTPRIVFSIARGIDRMYDIIQSNGNKYTVNSEHILCLKAINYPLLKYNNNKCNYVIKWIENNNFKTIIFKEKENAYLYFDQIKKNSLTNNNILEISIKDYLELSNNKKKILRGYKVPLDFPEKEITIDPYMLGTYLGNENIGVNYYLTNMTEKYKNIPDIYKYNTQNIRLKLLKGLIDSIGIYNNDIIELNINNLTLLNDTLFLVGSLGLKFFLNENNILCIYNGNLLNNNISYDLLSKINVEYVGIDDYYGFTLDNNCRFLLGDMTVTHNTCTAISIAEGFKKTLKNMNKKILVLSNLKNNFINELYNFKKERKKANPEDMVQCTGKEYELGEESMYLTFQQKEKEVKKMILSYYQFFGYQKFANYIVENTGGWKGNENDVDDKIKKFISKEFDNRVIIADEIQNIKTDKRGSYDLSKTIQPILQSIVKYGKNIKLVLMSATPMFDRPDEIIFYINLLLQNDGREKINSSDIFNKNDGTLKPNASILLKEVFKGYVSYMRASKPFLFPFRIYPIDAIIPSNINYYMNGEPIKKDKKIKFTKLILTNMKDVQLNTYLYYFNKKINQNSNENNFNKNLNNKNNKNDKNNENDKNNKNNVNNENNENDTIGLLSNLTKISNIVFPIAKTSKKIEDIGSFNKYSINVDYDNGLGGYYKVTKLVGNKKKIQFKYQDHAIFDKNTKDEAPFADEKHLHKFSSKFAKMLDVIKKSKGLCFVYSNYIDQGTLPFALMLEQNGFDREVVDGEYNLLDYNANPLKGGGKKRNICYLCGLEQSNKEHYEDKLPNYHIFRRAKYILYFRKQVDIVKIKREEALNKFRSSKNKYGEEVKVFIGTKTVSEGLDFQRIRQVHIMEPWYNLSRHEQIIGRAIRYYSHNDLPIDERNVEIYQYASILDNKNKYKNRETIDLKNYRISENKDIIIKQIARIMKESAVDCVFFRNSNIIETNKTVKQITASGNVIQIPLGDKPYSSICDYNEDCCYTCNWTPNPKKKYPINTDTYNMKFAINDIEKVKKYIKQLFRENIVYYLNNIEKKVFEKYPDIDKIFIYNALDQLANNKNEIVNDKFSRNGYIIYKGDYYIFQPFDLDRTNLPLIYRYYPENVKPDYVDLDNIEVNYTEEIVKNNNNLYNENWFIKNIFDNISKIYKNHENMVINNSKKNKNYYLLAIIGCVIDKLTIKQEIYFLKYLLTLYLNKETKIEYINNIIELLNIDNKLINFYADINYNKDKINNNIFVGFIVNNEYYIIDSVDKTENIKSIDYKKINFIICSNEIVAKIKSYRDLINKKIKPKQNNVIYGLLSIDKEKGIRKFKIVDKSHEENILTKEKKKSKRSIITGRMCSTYDYNKLNEFRNKLGMYKLTTKKKIDYICLDLEIYFRYMKFIDYTKIWFEEEK